MNGDKIWLVRAGKEEIRIEFKLPGKTKEEVQKQLDYTLEIRCAGEAVAKSVDPRDEELEVLRGSVKTLTTSNEELERRAISAEAAVVDAEYELKTWFEKPWWERLFPRV